MSTNSGLPNMTSPGSLVVTDAGLETWLVFEHGIDLPAFAAYPLVATPEGRALLTEYYRHYAEIARSVDAAVILDAPTWRANPDWADVLGHTRAALAELIEAAVGVVADVRREWTGSHPFLIGGAVGPRGDGYVIDATMDADEAAAYHSFQITAMASAGIDVVEALTIGYVDEAVGIVRAAEEAEVPVVISFTVETDGSLPSGMSLAEAIEQTDDSDERLCDPLHGELRAPEPLRARPRRRGTVGGPNREASAPMPPSSATRNSTRWSSWTAAIPTILLLDTSNSGRRFPTCTYSEAAAAPITDMSQRSLRPGVRPLRPDRSGLPADARVGAATS